MAYWPIPVAYRLATAACRDGGGGATRPLVGAARHGARRAAN